jgi:hypothetical protein
MIGTDCNGLIHSNSIKGDGLAKSNPKARNYISEFGACATQLVGGPGNLSAIIFAEKVRDRQRLSVLRRPPGPAIYLKNNADIGQPNCYFLVVDSIRILALFFSLIKHTKYSVHHGNLEEFDGK